MTATAFDLSPSRYADWKAPAGDSSLLIWPETNELIAATDRNHKTLNGAIETKLLGTPLSEVRAAARKWIGHLNDDQPVIATGHQTELWHAGVWVKNAVIHAAAEKMGGRAFHFAVDTDSPKHLLLRWPGASMPIADDERSATAHWSGLLNAPTPKHVADVRTALTAAARSWDFQPMVFDLLNSLERLSREQPRLPDALCNALHELDGSLGLRYDAMVVSPILESPPFLQFAAHCIANARHFAGDYNAALDAYRDEHGMTTAGRPMPDLFVSHEAIELPFWLDDLATGHRTRPSVFELEGRSVLKLVTGEEIAFSSDENGAAAALRLHKFLAETSHRISPRALTLTMFLRLFIADMFIHGIGGGRYDQVLDKLIHRHFGITPPTFAVATSTMFFPLAVGRSRACVPCVGREGHHLRHRSLGDGKREFLQSIESLPRRSRDRAGVFFAMQTALRNNWSTDPKLTAWERRLTAVREQEQRDVVEFDRELFYGVQPRERLTGLIERVQQEFA